MANFVAQVDIVYLWVDSNDKNWQKKKRKNFLYNMVFIQKKSIVFRLNQTLSSRPRLAALDSADLRLDLVRLGWTLSDLRLN